MEGKLNENIRGSCYEEALAYMWRYKWLTALALAFLVARDRVPLAAR